LRDSIETATVERALSYLADVGPSRINTTRRRSSAACLYARVDSAVGMHSNAPLIVADLESCHVPRVGRSLIPASQTRREAQALVSLARDDLDVAKAFSFLILDARPDLVVESSLLQLGPCSSMSLAMAWRYLGDTERALRIYKSHSRVMSEGVRIKMQVLGRDLAYRSGRRREAREFERLMSREQRDQVDAAALAYNRVRVRRWSDPSGFGAQIDACV